MKHIETKKGLETLLKRYLEAGVTDETMDANGGYQADWIRTIKGCIEEGFAMDKTDTKIHMNLENFGEDLNKEVIL